MWRYDFTECTLECARRLVNLDLAGHVDESPGLLRVIGLGGRVNRFWFPRHATILAADRRDGKDSRPALRYPGVATPTRERFAVSENEADEQKFNRMGLERVRILISTDGLPQSMKASAINWVAQRDAEERSRSEASQASQMRTARSTKNAAWLAAAAAMIAAIAAIITIVVTLK